ncbi:MAG: hypothetical protein IJX58_03925 [Clostridia bacterium]|nr:hypothetical protein [Clostridia bacterium]
MKNLIKSRRGIAIEMAVGAMFIMIALSIVLISVSNMQIDHRDNDLDEFNEKIESYQILDYIINNPEASGDVTINGIDYNITSKEKNENAEIDTYIEYIVTDKSNSETVLTITTKNGKITSWGN